MNTVQSMRDSMKRGWVPSRAWLASLALGFALTSAACGGSRVQTVPDFASMQAPQASVQLPQSRDALLAWVAGEHEGPEEALLAAWLRELVGDPDGALRALTAPLDWSSTPLFATSRTISIYALRDKAPDFDALAREWLSREGLQGVHPYDTWMRMELGHLLRAREAIRSDEDARVDGAAWGHPDLWNFYGPVSVMEAATFSEEPVGLKVASLGELPQDSVRRFAPVAPNVSRVEALEGSSGTVFLESFLHVDEPLDALLVVQSPGAYRIWIDGVEVDRRDPAQASLIGQHARRVHIGEGAHRVLVQLASRQTPNMSFRLVPLSGSIARFDNVPVRVSKSEVRASDWEHASALRWFERAPGAGGELAWLAQIPIAELTLDSAGIEELLAVAPTADHPLWRVARARLWNANLRWIGGLRQTRMLEEIRGVSDEWRPLSGVDELVVQLLTGSSQDVAAEAWLREVDSLAGASPRLVLQYAALLLRRGYAASAENMLRDLQGRYPQWCPAVEALIRVWAARGYPMSEETPAGVEGACSEHRVQLAWSLHAPKGEWDKVVDHSARVVARGPSRMDGWRRYLRALLSADELARYASVLDDAAGWGMPAAEVERWRLELAQAAQNDDARDEAMRARLALQPWELDWQHQVSFFAGEKSFESLRVDGLEVAREWFSQDRGRRGEIVYVLDYAAWRYFETTGGVNIVHQIVQLNSRDAVDQWGEIGVPSGNALLTLRAISPDGTVRVPERIAGKDSISLPALSVGDLIEIEYLRSIPPILSGEDFHDTALFYFASDSGEMIRSEMVIEYPRAWESEVSLELRNFEGTSVREREGDWIRERIRVNNSPQILAEPGMPSLEATAPTARMVVYGDVSKMVRAYRNRIVSAISQSPSLQQATHTLLEGARGDREKLFRIFRYVNDEVVDQSGFFSLNADQTLSAGRGDRYALMVAMLEAAGYRPEVVLLQSFGDDYAKTELPSLMRFGTAALTVRVGKAQYWLMAAGKNTPFDWILPETQGQEGIVIYGPREGRLVTTPVSAEREQGRVDVRIRVREDGSALVDVEERMSMMASSYQREDLEMMPGEDDRIRYLEYELGSQFLGMEVSSLEYVNPNEPDEPLIRRYSFVVPDLMLASEEGLYLDRAFFVPTHVYYYAGLERRRMPLITTYTHVERLNVTLEVPEGFRVVTSLAPVDEGWRGVRYHREASTAEGGRVLRWTREMNIPMLIVEPEDYAEYAAFMRDLAMAERIRVTLQPKP